MWSTTLNFSVFILISSTLINATKIKIVPNGSETTYKDGATHTITKYLLVPENREEDTKAIENNTERLKENFAKTDTGKVKVKKVKSKKQSLRHHYNHDRSKFESHSLVNGTFNNDIVQESNIIGNENHDIANKQKLNLLENKYDGRRNNKESYVADVTESIKTYSKDITTEETLQGSSTPVSLTTANNEQSRRQNIATDTATEVTSNNRRFETNYVDIDSDPSNLEEKSVYVSHIEKSKEEYENPETKINSATLPLQEHKHFRYNLGPEWEPIAKKTVWVYNEPNTEYQQSWNLQIPHKFTPFIVKSNDVYTDYDDFNLDVTYKTKANESTSNFPYYSPVIRRYPEIKYFNTNSYVTINGEEHEMDDNIKKYVVSRKPSHNFVEPNSNNFVFINGEKYVVDEQILTYLFARKPSHSFTKPHYNNYIIINGEKHVIDEYIINYLNSRKPYNILNNPYAKSYVVVNGVKYVLDKHIYNYFITHNPSNNFIEREDNNFVTINGEKHIVDDNILKNILSRKPSHSFVAPDANSFNIINGKKYVTDDHILKYIISPKPSNYIDSSGFIIVRGEKYDLDDNVIKYITSRPTTNDFVESNAHSFVIINGKKYVLDENILKYVFTRNPSHISNNQNIEVFEDDKEYKTEWDDGKTNNIHIPNKTRDDNAIKNIINVKQTHTWYPGDIDELENQNYLQDKVNHGDVSKQIYKIEDSGTDVYNIVTDTPTFKEITVETDTNYGIGYDIGKIERKYNLDHLKEFLVKLVMKTRIGAVENFLKLYDRVLNYVVVLHKRGVDEWTISQIIRNTLKQILMNMKVMLQKQIPYKLVEFSDCSQCLEAQFG